MWFPPIPHGPRDIVKTDRIPVADGVSVILRPENRTASFDLRPDLSVVRSVGGDRLPAMPFDQVEGLRDAVARRLANQAADAFAAAWSASDGARWMVSLPEFSPRAQPPRTARVTVREQRAETRPARLVFGRDMTLQGPAPSAWSSLGEDERLRIQEMVRARFAGPVTPVTVGAGGALIASFEKEEVRYPFRPVAGHPLGLDSAGRDVLARILYGFRTSITFGLILVMASMTTGTLIGAFQGYFGGRLDLFGQRFTEIWENLPFLYIIMLLGSVFGRSFALLLLCYGLFNWIGISYYMRAEFLKLRRQPFVEGAKCLGLPARKIMFRHILPNGLVPIVTFAPFSLIGAVSALAALDFLGFGLPPPTPSWGELLAQAQEFKWAWWLVLYPGVALFAVILLCVFIGEGVRAAFDPRRFSRYE
jgi:microcin C transport system permease protein